MRKFQTSLAVGFFMGSVVAGSQMFLLLFLMFFGYIEDRLENDLSVDGERFAGFLCLVQSLMLGAFAAILAAHRSEILDQKITLDGNGDGEDDAEDGNEGGTSSYNPPKQKVTVV